MDPDVIIIVNLAYGSPGDYRFFVGADRERVDFATVATATRTSMATFRTGGRQVVVVEPLPLPLRPSPDFDPLVCLRAQPCWKSAATRPGLPSRLELLYRRLALHNPKVHSLDLDQAVCPLFPTCDPMSAASS